MKILNHVWGSVLSALMLAACSHSDSGQDNAASSPQTTTQASSVQRSLAKSSQIAASSIQPTNTTQQPVTQQDDSTSSSNDTTANVPTHVPVIMAQPVIPTSVAPTGPGRESVQTTGCIQRDCQSHR